MPAIDIAIYTELQNAAGADFVTELADAFLEEAPLMLAELRDAQARGNAERFRRAAHSLKSNGLTFGATTLGAMARDLELGGLPDSKAPVVALAAEYDNVARALKDIRHG